MTSRLSCATQYRLRFLNCAIALCSLAACVTPRDLNSDAVAARPPQPVVTTRGRVPEPLADDLIAAAAHEANPTDRVALERLTEAIRRSLTQPLTTGNRVQALIDGPQTFAAMRRAIAKARHHVHVETHIFADDELGREFAQWLVERRRSGVEVRVIYDAVGSRTTPDEFFAKLRDAGVEVIEFRPLNPAKTWIGKMHNRDHRKIVVIDGATAFTGGLNISGAYSSASTSKPGPERGVDSGWRDTHVQITGPAAAQLQRIFIDTWQRLGGSIAPHAEYFPKLDSVGSALVSAVASIDSHQREEEIYHAHLAAIRNASRRIWITQAYFAPPAELRAALIEAAQRGVDVRVLVPGFTDSKLILYAAQSEYEPLLKGGVRIIERQDALLHAKTALIDDDVVFIGSANLDYRSFLHNNEVTAVIVGHDIAQFMADAYQADVRAGKELTLDAWRRRPLGNRFKEAWANLLKFWL